MAQDENIRPIVQSKTNPADKLDLTFERINSGHQIDLSDGSVWRVSPGTAASAFGWERGDPVEISERRGDEIWRFSIRNLRRGGSTNVIPSTRLSAKALRGIATCD